MADTLRKSAREELDGRWRLGRRRGGYFSRGCGLREGGREGDGVDDW